ncbi:hypothetical protein IEO21_06693 [Rhodonia placenta]|uniref:Uncharacterized protein n=1 Tax=Rhodonia placenta TaxID=104341 RepID=A0A8H7U113_9APHY|nr:hypothetical protein IEO21_06693 [Postia placenta]
MEDGPGAEAVVVAVHQVDFGGNECASGLAVATVVQVLKEVRGQCHIRQRLLMWRGVQPVMRPNQEVLWLWRRVLREIGISSCLTWTGDSLRETGARRDRAGVPEHGSGCVGAAGTKRVLDPSDGLVILIILLD